MQLYYSSDSDTATIASDNQTNRDFISILVHTKGMICRVKLTNMAIHTHSQKNDVSMQIYTQL